LVLFKLHWDWAKEIAGIADRSGRDSLADPNGLSISRAITQFFTDIVADVEPSDPIYPELARRSPALVGYPAEVLFTPQEIHVWQQQAIHDYAIRDWSRAPYGAGCHAWAPGAKSWEVRADLSAFGFSGQEDVKNLHICGEAYSDYQGFIEGALRSAADAAQTI